MIAAIVLGCPHFSDFYSIFEPRHDKTNKMSVGLAKTQISLGICPVWSESSLCAQWVNKDPSFLHADSEDWSDWADAKAYPKLRWAQTHFVGFVMSRLISWWFSAVRTGNLPKFNEVLSQYGPKFQTEDTYTLIIRLRHNVIKTGVRMINLSYSRISLVDIAQKLTLDSPEDAEYIVAKVILDLYACSMSLQLKGRGHVAFGVDPVGVAHCLHSISWTNGCILTKLAQTHY